MMSDSTNTVQTVVRRTGFFALSEMSPISSRLSISASAALPPDVLLPAVAAAWAQGLSPALLAAGIDTFTAHSADSAAPKA